MPIVALMFLVQLAVAAHVVRTGRPTFWVWLVVFVPVLGCALYFVTQVLPEATASRAARRAIRTVELTVDPDRTVRNAVAALRTADTVENKLALADALMARARFAEARILYAQCLVAPFEHDAETLRRLAEAEFEDGDPQAARRHLEQLIEHNPDYRSAAGHLLYARCLESLGELERAVHEYDALVRGYPGEEAAVRYANLLRHLGRDAEARELLRMRVERAELAPTPYRTREREWLCEAGDVLRSIDDVATA